MAWQDIEKRLVVRQLLYLIWVRLVLTYLFSDRNNTNKNVIHSFQKKGALITKCTLLLK